MSASPPASRGRGRARRRSAARGRLRRPSASAGPAQPGATLAAARRAAPPPSDGPRPPGVGWNAGAYAVPTPRRDRRRVRALARHREVLGLPAVLEAGPAGDEPSDMAQLTTIAYFGVEAHQDGHLIRVGKSGAVPPGWAASRAAPSRTCSPTAHAAHVRVVLTVQRFAWTSGAGAPDGASCSRTRRPARRWCGTSPVDRQGSRARRHQPRLRAGAGRGPRRLHDLRPRAAGGPRRCRTGLQLTFDLTTAISTYDLAGAHRRRWRGRGPGDGLRLPRGGTAQPPARPHPSTATAASG